MIAKALYPSPQRLQLPVTPYEVTGRAFGQRVRSRLVLMARHLGDDVVLDAGVPISAIGEGVVVWSEIRPGSKEHRNWGGIVVVAHKDAYAGTPFFSLYGHLKNLAVKEGDTVTASQRIGEVAPGPSPENGWWLTPHVHFAIYTGPWVNQILPGYSRPFEGRTKFSWWQNPLSFIEAYNEHAIAEGSKEGQA